MFRNMKRQDRVLSKEETLRVLEEEKFGVLSIIGKQDVPYGVPMHYVMMNGCLYFHTSAEDGLKDECLKEHPSVCFTIVQTEDGVKCNSAIVFGQLKLANQLNSIVLEKIVEKFIPPFAWENAKRGIPFSLSNIKIYELKMEHMSGKWIDKPENKG